MKKITYGFGLILTLALLLAGSSVSAQSTASSLPSARACYIFTRNLQTGTTGEDVRQLQITLNQNTDTQVSISGAGSPGNETTYFGPATLRAIIKFQEKYSFEVLAPAGLARGTGFVGRLTLAKLNKLCNITPIDPQAPVVQTISAPTSLAVGEKGTWKINAYDPNGGNQLNYTITWGDELMYTMAPSSGATLDRSMPIHNAETTHAFSFPGTFTQTFVISNLVGKSTTVKTTVNVGNVITGAPTITSITPVSGLVGTNVRIYGTNLTNTTAIEFGSGFIPKSAIRNYANTINSGYLEFTVPDYIGICPSTAQICAQVARQVSPGIYDIAVTNSSDTSNKMQFTVTSSTSPNITVVSPNGGENLVRGTQYTIRWATPNVTYIQAPRFDIKLHHELPECAKSRPGQPICLIAIPAPYTIAANVIGSGGISTYSWNVGAISDTSRSIPDGRYQIEVCTQGGGSCDMSDGVFMVNSTSAYPAITITSPKNGEVWHIGSTKNIEFTYNPGPTASLPTTLSVLISAGHPKSSCPAGYECLPLPSTLIANKATLNYYNDYDSSRGVWIYHWQVGTSFDGKIDQSTGSRVIGICTAYQGIYGNVCDDSEPFSIASVLNIPG